MNTYTQYIYFTYTSLQLAHFVHVVDSDYSCSDSISRLPRSKFVVVLECNWCILETNIFCKTFEIGLQGQKYNATCYIISVTLPSRITTLNNLFHLEKRTKKDPILICFFSNGNRFYFGRYIPKSITVLNNHFD